MKKVNLESLKRYFDTEFSFIPESVQDAYDEICIELEKSAAEKVARISAYESIHSLIVDNLNNTPITCTDLFAEIEPEVLSAGMNRYNVQYALNNMWQDEIEKIPGKPNTYKRR